MKMNLPRLRNFALFLVMVYSTCLVASADDSLHPDIEAEFPEKPVDDRLLMRNFSSKLGKMVDEQDVPSADQIRNSLMELDEQNHRAPVAKVSVDARDGELRPSEVYRNHIDATLVFGSVYNCGRCSKWHTGGMATAWVLDTDGIVVSNYHVVDDKKADRFFGVATRDGQVFPVVEVLAANKHADISVLRVDIFGKKFKSALQLGSQPDIGKGVVVLSNPKRRFFSLTKGYVSRYYILPRREKGVKVPQMTITADYAVGSSGGPVLDLSGHVVGMVRSTQTVVVDGKDDDPDKVQMVFKDCVPVASIRAMLNEAKN